MAASDQASISANPTTANVSSTHTVTAQVEDEDVNQSLESLNIDYNSASRKADAQAVGMGDVQRVGVDTDGDGAIDADLSGSLTDVTHTNNYHTLTVRFDGSQSLGEEDTVVVSYGDVVNPSESGEFQTQVSINYESTDHASRAYLSVTANPDDTDTSSSGTDSSSDSDDSDDSDTDTDDDSDADDGDDSDDTDTDDPDSSDTDTDDTDADDGDDSSDSDSTSDSDDDSDSDVSDGSDSDDDSDDDADADDEADADRADGADSDDSDESRDADGSDAEMPDGDDSRLPSSVDGDDDDSDADLDADRPSGDAEERRSFWDFLPWVGEEDPDSGSSGEEDSGFWSSLF